MSKTSPLLNATLPTSKVEVAYDFTGPDGIVLRRSENAIATDRSVRICIGPRPLTAVTQLTMMVHEVSLDIADLELPVGQKKFRTAVERAVYVYGGQRTVICSAWLEDGRYLSWMTNDDKKSNLPAQILRAAGQVQWLEGSFVTSGTYNGASRVSTSVRPLEFRMMPFDAIHIKYYGEKANGFVVRGSVNASRMCHLELDAEYVPWADMVVPFTIDDGSLRRRSTVQRLPVMWCTGSKGTILSFKASIDDYINVVMIDDFNDEQVVRDRLASIGAEENAWSHAPIECEVAIPAIFDSILVTNV